MKNINIDDDLVACCEIMLGLRDPELPVPPRNRTLFAFFILPFSIKTITLLWFLLLSYIISSHIFFDFSLDHRRVDVVQ